MFNWEPGKPETLKRKLKNLNFPQKFNPLNFPIILNIFMSGIQIFYNCLKFQT